MEMQSVRKVMVELSIHLAESSARQESYTSKASFLDQDPIPTYQANQASQPVFSGTRIARSWYRASDGTIMHADVNGSDNILRKRSSDTRASGARRSGSGSSPQTAGRLNG
jgi:putative transposase